MELFDSFNMWGLFFITWGVVFVIALIVGVIIAAASRYGDTDAVGGMAMAGTIFGFIIAIVIVGSSVDERNTDIHQTFEDTYQVSVVEGTVPTSTNDRNSLLMFTQNGGPKACIVSTDDVEYTVVCDGKELRPINVK